MLILSIICAYVNIRYALDMNVERAQDVLMHKRLLDIARAPTTAFGPAVEVRLVQVIHLETNYVTCFYISTFRKRKK